MFKVYKNDSVFGSCVSHSDVLDVSDKSSFRPDSEQVRALKFNPQGVGNTPMYDYPNGDVPKDDTVTAELIALRSGKLDKADIEKVKRDILNNAVESDNNAKADKLAKAVESALGISDNND